MSDRLKITIGILIGLALPVTLRLLVPLLVFSFLILLLLFVLDKAVGGTALAQVAEIIAGWIQPILGG